MVIPNYEDGSIVNLVSSVKMGLGGSRGPYAPATLLPPDVVANAANVVLFVIDGLGYQYLKRRESKLDAHIKGSLTSVFPSTTASAVTSFLTGVAPQQHAVTGWFMYLKELGTVSVILPFRPRWGGGRFDSAGVDIGTLIGAAPLCDYLDAQSHMVLPNALVDSPFSAKMSGRSRRMGYKDLGSCFACVRRAIRKGGERHYVYAYWPLFDSLAHAHGVESIVVERHFRELEMGLVSCLEALSGTDTLLIVTSDHGFIDTSPASITRLAAHQPMIDCLSAPLCGEPRVAYCYVHPRESQRFEDYVCKHLGERCDLYASEDLLEMGWFGLGEPDVRLLDRIGDYVLVMKGEHVINDSLTTEDRWANIGVHGGTSEDEMYVPLITVRC